MNTQSITLDVSKKPAIMPILRIGQGDKNGTTIQATIYDNGSPLSLSGYSVRFEMRLPDGTSYYQSPSGTISGNVATIPIDETYAGAVDGVAKIAYIVVYNNSVVCSTSRVNVIVLESAEEGADAAHAYSSGIIEATDAANAAAASATSAASAASAAATSATSAASSASSAATNANAKAELADTAATAANAAATAADTAREAIQDDLAAKADKDGYYPLLSAGTSDALFSGDFTVDTFAQRVSDHDGACRVDSLRGRTVVWNQLVRFTGNSTHNGVDYVSNADGTVTANGTANGNSYTARQVPSIPIGHKILIKGCPAGGDSATYSVYATGTGISPTTARDVGNGAFATVIGSTPFSIVIYITNGTSVNNMVFRPQLFDLTAMFGAGNESSTVAEFEAMFPDAYYPYNAGSLLSVNIEGVKTVGFNQWDEVWESGIIDSQGGSSSSDSAIRSKNYIKALPNTVYSATRPVNTPFFVAQYDSNKSFISRTGLSMTSAFATFTTASNTAYLKFSIGNATTPYTKYNNDICINLSDPALNGTYRPYTEQTREIPASTYFPTGIKSAGTAYDELTSSKAVTRIGAVDLGTLNWASNATSQSGVYRMVVSLTGAKSASGSNTEGNIVCAKYDTISQDATWRTDAIGIAIGSNDSVLRVYDSNYNTSESAAAFKTAMSGVQLCYELATPTTYTLTPQTINTLQGVNNVWADSGDCSIEYYADTKLYIDKKLGGN